MLGAILSIAGGGALGSVARYGLTALMGKLWGAEFPWGTMLVNIAGSFVMGLFLAAFEHFGQPSQSLRLFVLTGFLGGFTTFSAFSADFAGLWERQNYAGSLLYLGGSVFLSLAAIFAAMAFVKGLTS